MFKNFVFFICISFFLMHVLTSCSKTTSSTALLGNWVERSQLLGPKRTGAVVFVINDTAYVGAGLGGLTALNTEFTDFYRYDSSNAWSQVADASVAGFQGRHNGIAFASSTAGYVGLGYITSSNTLMSDLWKYVPSTNTWSQLTAATYPGGGRTGAVAFAIGNYAYVGTGTDNTNSYKDFYRFDMTADAWSGTLAFPGFKRVGAVAFVYNNMGYVCTGWDNNVNLTDFYSFNPASGFQSGSAWTQLTALSNIQTDTYDDLYGSLPRHNAEAFVMGSKGYLTTGVQSSALTDAWEYDFSSDRWTQKTDFEGAARYGAIGFSIKSIGFVGTGYSGNVPTDNFWRFAPNDTYNAND